MINKIINHSRKEIAKNNLINYLSNSIFWFIILIYIFSFIESIFYLNMYIRYNIFCIACSLFIIIFLYSIFKFFITHFSLLNNYNDIIVSKIIGEKYPSIKDRLTNTIQIQKLEGVDKNLIELAKNNLNKKLSNTFNKTSALKISKIKIYQTIFCLVFFILTFIIFNLNQPIHRIVNFNKSFAPPLPFTLHSKFGNFSSLEGDSIYIDIYGKGNIPDSISLFIKKNDKLEENKIGKNGNHYEFHLINTNTDIIYWSEFKNNNFFSSWDKIFTDPDTIILKGRPKLLKYNFTIDPPEYTNQSTYLHNQTNITQLEILKNSKITFEIIANKKLTSSWILNNGDRTDLYINDNIISNELILKEDMKFAIYCLDENNIPNINPTQFSFISKNDKPPNIIIKEPADESEIDESFNIPLNFNIIDDIGVSKVWIEHSIFNPDFPNINSKITEKSVYNQRQKNKNNLLINEQWDISQMNLLMGDELHFHVLAQDNNINEINIVKSQKLIAKFPSIEDIFYEIENYENQTTDWMEDIHDSVDEISEVTENIKLDLLKSDEITWEQQQKIENTFEEIADIANQMEEIKSNIEKILEKAEENNLFNKDLTDKFEKLQDMLQNIMSPELMEAIQQMQQSLKNADINKIMESLENYEFNIEKFEEQMDRFIDMFELALAEQKLNELSKFIENMINKESQLIQNIIDEDSNEVLNKKSSKQENRFNDLKSLLNEASSFTENISQNTSEEIDNLIKDPIMTETSKNLSNQTNQINKKNKNESMISAQLANNNLKEISNIVNEINEQFNNENKNKMSKEFIVIINNLLVMSNQQENIIKESSGIRSNSPKIRLLNQKQYNVDKELVQLTSQLIELSNKTFFVNPKINRYIGQLKTTINKCISFFEQKQIRNGKKEQLNILKKINIITALLLESMQEMQDSNSSSGFEKFMEALENISNQQQGVNQGTMQMGQMGMMQQQIMEQLQQQQQELKEKLGELIGNNPGQDHGGGLNKAAEDMDKVIDDFINKNITQKTIDRQQKILSRMLDSQKSLQEKDFENKRESVIAETIEYLGPLGLPNDLGEKDLLLINALESAIEENMPLEYNSMIQSYFLNLQKKEFTNEK